ERDVKTPWVLDEQENGPQHHTDGEGSADTVNVFGTAGGLIVNDDRDMTWEKVSCIPLYLVGGLNKTRNLKDYTLVAANHKTAYCREGYTAALRSGNVDAFIKGGVFTDTQDAVDNLNKVLYKLRKQRPDVFKKLEVYIDDVVKALCLGATAVGMGRPFLYAQSAYGEAGVSKIITILEREITTAMRLLGASSSKDLKPEMVERVDWEPVVRSKL
ncbi:hypothetical protein MPER_06798, partial [Moniliophthora perniciosa FA553]